MREKRTANWKWVASDALSKTKGRKDSKFLT